MICSEKSNLTDITDHSRNLYDTVGYIWHAIIEQHSIYFTHQLRNSTEFNHKNKTHTHRHALKHRRNYMISPAGNPMQKQTNIA